MTDTLGSAMVPGARRRWIAAALLATAMAGAPAAPGIAAPLHAQAGHAPGAQQAAGDTLDPNWVPTGFGTLRQVVLPQGNARDLDELPADVRDGVAWHPVRTMDEVLALALAQAPPTEAR